MLILLTLSSAPSATTIYSYNFPSLQAAVDQAGPGDKVFIAPGRYRERVTLHRSGTTDRPIIITGADTRRSIIDGTDLIPATAWLPCGNHLYRLSLTDWPHLATVALWEDGERLLAVAEEPPTSLDGGSYYVPPSSWYGRTAAARRLCPTSPLVNGPVAYVRPRHPHKVPMALRMEIATRPTLLTTPPDVTIANIHIQNIAFVRSAPDPTRGTLELHATRAVALGRLRFEENGSRGIRAIAPHQLRATTMEMTGAFGPFGGGIDLTTPTQLTLQDNFIHDSTGPGIHLVYDPRVAAPSAHALRIVNNILWANTGANLRIDMAESTAPACEVAAMNTLIKGNVIVGAYGDGTYFPIEASGLSLHTVGNILVRENLFVGNQHALSFDATRAPCPPGRTKLSDNLLLFSFGDHIRTVANQMDTPIVRNNLYSERRDDNFLQGLFAHSAPVLEFAAPVAAPAAPAFIDAAPHTIPIRHTVLNGQLPFVYAPPRAATAGLPPREALTVIRLAGGQGVAKIQLALSPDDRPVALESLRVTFNGRVLPLNRDAPNTVITDAPLSPWQNWLVVSVPQGLQLDLVRVLDQPYAPS